MECQIIISRHLGLNICQFSGVKESENDVTSIDAKTTMHNGQLIEKASVTGIQFFNSDLEEIPSAIFDEENFKNIVSLRLDGGSLKYVNKDNFEDASKLRVLEIFNSQIHEISSQAFKFAESLEEIIIKDSTIERIDEEAFIGLKKLKKLQLVNCNYPNNHFFKHIPKRFKSILLTADQ